MVYLDLLPNYNPAHHHHHHIRISCITDLDAYSLAIILDNFGDQCSMSDAEVTAEILDEFDETWAKFDPKGTGKIDEDLLPELLMMVEYPLGLKDLPFL